MKTSPAIALAFLRKDEWTMGNGQCHVCCGCKPRRGWWTETVGHERGCKLAKAIEALGGKVVWSHENHSKRRRSLEKWFRDAWKRV